MLVKRKVMGGNKLIFEIDELVIACGQCESNDTCAMQVAREEICDNYKFDIRSLI